MPNLVPGLKQEEERARLAMASSAVQTVGAHLFAEYGDGLYLLVLVHM